MWKVLILSLLVLGTVQQCTGVGCLACPANPAICTECDTANGYYLQGPFCCDTNAGNFPDGGFGCAACGDVIENCETCTVNEGTGDTECTACVAPFEVSGGTICCDVNNDEYPDGNGACAACTDLIEGCTTCTANGGVTGCTECNEAGQYVLSGATCCSGGGQQYPDSNGGCEPCAQASVGCQTCQYNAATSGVDCIICSPGYDISVSICCDSTIGGADDVNGGCLGCPEGCSTCSNNGGSLECNSCSAGYVLSGTDCCQVGLEYPFNNACGSCEDVHPGCFFCGPDPDTGEALCTGCSVDLGYFQSGTTCCDANNDQYPDGNDGCQACAIVLVGCLECNFEQGFQATQCNNCDEAGGFLTSGTICCDTNNEFYPTDNGCQACSDAITGCATCNYDQGNQQLTCATCDSDNGYAISGTTCCNSLNDQYPVGNDVCAPCSVAILGCNTCVLNGQEVGCTNCIEANGYLISGSECCDTNAGQFPDGADSCDACANVVTGCSTCVNNDVLGVIQCQACNTGAGFELSGTICCDANNNQFPDGNGGCTDCPIGCTQCALNGGNIECSACDTDGGFQLSGTVCCDTNIDAYPDGNNACDACDTVIPGCTSCVVNAGNTQCETCNTDGGFVISGTICCATGAQQFPTGAGNCDSCANVVAGCTTCVYNNGNTQCSICNTGGGFQISGTICCDTNSGQYPDGVDNCNSCSNVISGCSTCVFNNGNTECQTCNDGFEISGTICCDTNNGQYPQAGGTCDTCSSVITGCQTCVVNNGVTECQACNTAGGFQLSGTICCDAGSGSLPDGNGGCGGCSAGCTTCTSPTDCQVCDTANGFELSGDVCCETTADSYPDGAGGCDTCVSVIQGCQTCTFNNGETECTQCNTATGYVLSGVTCCGTVGGQFPDGNDGCNACATLFPGCSTCVVNNEATQCQACDTVGGFEISGIQCCDLNADSYPDGADNCESCASIIPGCSTCQVNGGTTVCIACNTAGGFQLTSPNLCCDTNNDQYPDGNDGCDACGALFSGCSTCEVNGGTTECTACDTVGGFQLTSPTLCCDTNNNQYPDENDGCDICSAVIAGCSTCEVNGGNTECTACNTVGGFTLSGTICCDGNSNFIPDGNGGCTECAEGCLACTETACTECDTASGYYISGPLCCNSNDNQYPDGASGCTACTNLVENCETCTVNEGTGVTECAACVAPFEVSGGTICCDVNNDEYPDGNGACAACTDLIEGCTTCTANGGVTGCTECNEAGQYVLSGATCCSGGGQQYPDGNGGCEPCAQASVGCQTCQYNAATSGVDCIICSPGYDISVSICCDSTIGGADDVNGGCLGCPEGCSTCSNNGGSLECNSCSAGYVLSGTDCCQVGLEYPFNNACGSCEDVHPGCFFCGPDPDTGEALCTGCSVDLGYFQSGTTCCDANNDQYPDGNDGCQACAIVLVGCLECNFEQGFQATQCNNCDEAGGFLTSGTICCDTNNEFYPDDNGGCQACSTITGCATCNYDQGNQQLTCATCDSDNGYAISGTICCDTNNNQYPAGNDLCDTCSNVIQGCDTCGLDGQNVICAACNTAGGYELSGVTCCDTNNDAYPSNNVCEPCGDIFIGCATCNVENGVTECTACNSAGGYQLSGGVCCDGNNDLYPNNDVCEACGTIITGCSTCQVNAGVTQCLACNTAGGYQLAGVTCCDTNNDAYPSNNACEPCGDIVIGCTACNVENGVTECTACNSAGGYQLAGGVCCDGNNDLYPNNDVCEACGTIITGCTSCSVNNGVTECTACNTAGGYELSGATCCHTNNNQYPHNDGCDGCEVILPGCSVCNVNAGTTQCTACNTVGGFYISGTQCCDSNSDSYPDSNEGCASCADIISGCTTCEVQNGETQCRACDTDAGFQLSGATCCDGNANSIPDGNGGCTGCPSGCLNCQTNGGTITCVECNNAGGFYLSGGECCDSNADSFPDANDGCSACDTIINGCTSCAVNNEATECQACDIVNGFELSGIDCCDTNNDAYPAPNGGCQSCATVINGCTQCVVTDGVTGCTTCGAAGFQLSGTTCCNTANDEYPDTNDGCSACVAVILGCDTCEVNGGVTECTACQVVNGFLPSGGICCDTNSDSFPDGAGSCDLCGNLITGCTSCDANSGVTQCIQCDTANLFQLSGTTCCETDNDQYPHNDDCSTCGEIFQGCTSCVVNGGVTECQACDTGNGYELSGTVCCNTAIQFPNMNDGCDACSTIIPGCNLCEANGGVTECTQCDIINGYEISGATCCNTNNQQYPNGNDGCSACSEIITGCTTCEVIIGETSCSICDSGFEISQGVVSICCETGTNSYPDTAGGCGSCVSIFSGCQTCQVNNGNTECTACSAGYQLSGIECCDLGADQYPDPNGGCDSCINLITGCSSCTVNAGTTECSGCDTVNGYQLSGVQCCDTNAGQYPDNAGGCDTCSNVHPGCTICMMNGGVTQCTNCDTGAGFISSGNTCCDTNAGEYPDNVGDCGTCSEVIGGCQSCNLNEGATECTQCDIANGFQLSGTICCDTNSGSLPDGNGGCTGCPEGCVVCSSPTQCLTCETDSGYYISGEQCCDSNNNFFPDGDNSCAACSNIIAGCSTCVVNAGTTQCQDCDTDGGFQRTSSTLCCDINNDQYPDGNSGCMTCSTIIAGCSTCVVNAGTTQCQDCDTAGGFEISGTICCNTNNDEYPVGNNLCAPCSVLIEGCSECVVDDLGNTECAGCDSASGFELTSPTVCCNGNNDQYPDGNEGCTSCSSVTAGCSQCSVNGGVTQCSGCDSVNGFELSGTQCCDTNNGQYPDGNEGCDSCASVIPGCSQCTVEGDTSCSTCDAGLGFVPSGDICCDTGNNQVPDNNGGCDTCANAIPGCQTCSLNGDQTECTSCEPGFQPSGTICCEFLNNEYPDGNGGCDSCSGVISGCQACLVSEGSTECIICDANAGFQQSGTTCCDTNNGQVPDGNGGCDGCPEGCTTCSSTTTCTSCDTDNGYELSGTQCCDTNSDQYPDGNGGCESCADAHEGCLFCQLSEGVAACVACDIQNGFENSGDVCCNINNSEYPDGNGGCDSCGNVFDGCIVCSVVIGTSFCDVCDTDSGFELSQSICCDTNNDEYPDGNGGCTSCSSVTFGCTQCSVNAGVTQCSGCDTASGFEISGEVCCNTNNDEYPDGNGGCDACMNVNPGCSDCSVSGGSTECDTCNTAGGYYLSGDICCNTNNNEYPDVDGGCTSCSEALTGCSACSVNNGLTVCIFCASGYQISGDVCCDANAGSLPDGNGGCTGCPVGCLACSGNVCNTCNIAGGYLPSGDICCDTNVGLGPNGNGGCSLCSDVISGCDSCVLNAGTISCDQCADGFVPSGDICCDTNAGSQPDGNGGCTGCPTGCFACNGAVCSVCNTAGGYYLSGDICCNTNIDEYPDGNGGCSSCSETVTGCSTCSMSAGVPVCTGCDTASGYQISGDVCCDTNIGSQPDGNGGCSGCSDGCLACSSPTVCVSCDIAGGYVPSGAICCNGNAGEYPNGIGGCGTCSNLISGCLACEIVSGDTQCSSCNVAAGFEPSGAICCDTNNDEFPTGVSICSSCSVEITGCSTCSYNDGIQCDGCSAGFELSGNQCCHLASGQFPDGTGGCSSCSNIISGCQNCIINDGQTSCQSCSAGYALSGDVCCNSLAGSQPDGNGGCTGCPQGCLACSSSSVCDTCDVNNGYIQAGISCCDTNSGSFPTDILGIQFCSQCGLIISGCALCDYSNGQTSCLVCDTANGFEFSAGDTCCETAADQFPDGLGDCSSCSSLFTNCQTCSFNSAISSTICSQCIDNFAFVNGVCTQCASGQAVHSDGMSCVSCSVIHPNCIACDDESTCTACSGGFQVLETGETCTECASINEFCLACDDASTCTECAYGYALTAPTICTECVENEVVSDDGASCVACNTINDNCFFCSDENTCTGCVLNYALTDPTTCTLCTSTQVVSDDRTSCVECSTIHPNCISCSSSSVCDACSSGYVVVGFDTCQALACQAIDQNCATCTANSCTQCLPGYARNGNTCIPCGFDQTVSENGEQCVNCGDAIANCVQCSAVNVCEKCSGDLVLTSPTSCSSCADGEVFDGTNCVACTLANCDVCATQFTCRECSAGYVRNETTNLCVDSTTITTTCGDFYELTEGCDDGNANSGDGCSSTCTVEAGYTCINFQSFISTCVENCGNGQLDDGESCDDGNTNNFDGCSSACETEEGFNCASGVCLQNCGNGDDSDAGESCDDGNNRGGDGCSSTCQEETGWACINGLGCFPICGDGIRVGLEECDDGNSGVNDGCSPGCQAENGWACEGSLGEKSICRQFENFCGNGVYQYEKGERCDDGNLINGDGCSSTCVIEADFNCDTSQITSDCSRCGNGKSDAGEQCDDGNRNSLDGCSAVCQLEDGFECNPLFPAFCVEVTVCFDGAFDSQTEGCDDGNNMDGDGCSRQCQVENGWECVNFEGGVSQCSLIPACGNGAFEPVTNGEGCDDGNNFSGDGCSANCGVEMFYKCNNIVGQRSFCERDYQCGNALQEQQNAEECDDGNNLNGDGCNFNCRIENGWGCRLLRTGRSFCVETTTNPGTGDDNTGGQDPNNPDPDVPDAPVCGNARREANEQCDDGNNNNGDGCSALCQTENFFECLGGEGQRSVCRPICGNAEVNPGEECDDGNNVSGDGCTSDCRLEPGYFCPDGEDCISLCGNSERDASFNEGCDDGNQINGDGCSSICQIETGWECFLLPNDLSFCSRICGNGRYEPLQGEECDDGNFAPNDGCFECVREDDWICSQIPGLTSECRSDRVAYCGNGKFEPLSGEECDDGNTINTDGCSNACTENANFFCSNIPGERSVCEFTNDGTCVEGAEIPNLLLKEEELTALAPTDFGNVLSISQLVPMLVTNQNGDLVTDVQAYATARNAYYARGMHFEWFVVDHYVNECLGN